MWGCTRNCDCLDLRLHRKWIGISANEGHKHYCTNAILLWTTHIGVIEIYPVVRIMMRQSVEGVVVSKPSNAQ